MAVPKKRTSKSRKRARKTTWQSQASREALKAISLGKSVLSDSPSGFIYLSGEEESVQETDEPTTDS
jgi:large subunit ribosomal protein L32